MNSDSTPSSAQSVPQAAHLLYKIIASRNKKHSTALVANVDFDESGRYLPDGPRAPRLLGMNGTATPGNPERAGAGYIVPMTLKRLRPTFWHAVPSRTVAIPATTVFACA